MRRSKVTENQIVGIMCSGESGLTVDLVCRNKSSARQTISFGRAST